MEYGDHPERGRPCRHRQCLPVDLARFHLRPPLRVVLSTISTKPKTLRLGSFQKHTCCFTVTRFPKTPSLFRLKGPLVQALSCHSCGGKALNRECHEKHPDVLVFLLSHSPNSVFFERHHDYLRSCVIAMNESCSKDVVGILTKVATWKVESTHSKNNRISEQLSSAPPSLCSLPSNMPKEAKIHRTLFPCRL